MTGQNEKRRRRQWSGDEKHRLVQRWKASGLSARAFAMQEGLPASNLSKWSKSRRSAGVRDVRADERARRTVTFAPVQVETKSSLHRDTSGHVQLELDIGSARVRVFAGADARMLSELVLAVAGRA